VDDVALFFHILGALAFASGIVVAGVAFEARVAVTPPQKLRLGQRVDRCGAWAGMLPECGPV
jgi:hypothetical protein